MVWERHPVAAACRKLLKTLSPSLSFSRSLSVFRAPRLKLIPLCPLVLFFFSSPVGLFATNSNWRAKKSLIARSNRRRRRRRRGDSWHVACVRHTSGPRAAVQCTGDIYLRVFNLLYTAIGGTIIFSDNGAPLCEVRRNVSP